MLIQYNNNVELMQLYQFNMLSCNLSSEQIVISLMAHNR